jgi:hypothetical protein
MPHMTQNLLSTGLNLRTFSRAKHQVRVVALPLRDFAWPISLARYLPSLHLKVYYRTHFNHVHLEFLQGSDHMGLRATQEYTALERHLFRSERSQCTSFDFQMDRKRNLKTLCRHTTLYGQLPSGESEAGE